MKIRIGTRSSQLALWQAEHVAQLIENLSEDYEVELVTMSTKGDRILEKPLAEIGGKGLFTEELEKAMIEGRIDLAVHSLKDMPVELPEGLTLGAFTKREEPWDALVSPKYKRLEALPQGAKVGTSSLRRQAQLWRLRPDLKIEMVRGNVNTRLRKLEEEGFDGIILALAGLKRLGLAHHATEILSMDTMLPAVGQGVLAIECLQGSPMEELIRPLMDEDTHCAVQGERSFLKRLNGGCQVPIGVHAICEGDHVVIHGFISSLSGDEVHEGTLRVPRDKAAEGGRQLAEGLLEDGAQHVVDQLTEEGVLK